MASSWNGPDLRWSDKNVQAGYRINLPQRTMVDLLDTYQRPMNFSTCFPAFVDGIKCRVVVTRVCMHARARVHWHIHTRARACALTHTHTYAHTHARTHAHTHTYTQRHFWCLRRAWPIVEFCVSVYQVLSRLCLERISTVKCVTGLAIVNI